MTEGIKSMEQPLSPVREATPADVEAIVDIQYRTWMATYPPIIDGVDAVEVEEYFEANDGLQRKINNNKERLRAADPNAYVGVFVGVDERIQGFVVAARGEDDNSSCGEVKALYVAPESQGEGAGAQLMLSALTYLDVENRESIVHVVTSNEKAISFYEKFGFRYREDVPLTKRTVMPNGTVIPEVEMHREPSPL